MNFSFSQKNHTNHFIAGILILSVILVGACNSGPKMIEAESDASTENSTSTSSAQEVHKVVAQEVLQTEKYTYLRVTEDGNETWIAVPKTNAEVGATYYYKGGLKKTNFKSVEHNRIFETVYLVSGISTSPAAGNITGAHMHVNTSPGEGQDQNITIDPPEDGITIAELFENRSQYGGKTVRVRGRCVKRNNMIMDRNWVHIQDGTLDDEEQNLTVTTMENIPLGAVVTFEGVIALNKDFGAGYKYEIIMEEAHVVQ